MFLPFQGKDNPKGNYLQLSQFPDSIPVSSQGISVDDYFQIRYLYPARAYLSTITIPNSIPISSQGMSVDNNSRFDSCIQPEHICEQLIVDSTPVSSQGISAWKDWRSNTCNKPGNYLSFSGQRSTPVSSQESYLYQPFAIPNSIPVASQGTSVSNRL